MQGSEVELLLIRLCSLLVSLATKLTWYKSNFSNKDYADGYNAGINQAGIMLVDLVNECFEEVWGKDEEVEK